MKASDSVKREHAIVIGASMAGLLAARALSDHFAHVTVIERDTLPEDASFRPGVPQSRHVHGFLMCGLGIFREWFPGIDADLDAAGVETVEWMHQTLQRMPTGWTPRYHSGVITRSVLRTTLEAITRRRVKAISNVRFCDGLQVAGLIATPDKRKVIGVQVEPRRKSTGDRADEKTGGIHPAPTTEIYGDLVIDASGRGSQAGAWLTELGYGAPSTQIVNAHLGYATRYYRFPPEHEPEWRGLLMLPAPDVANGGGGVFVVMDDKWLLTLAGVADRVPPTDEAGFNAYIRGLECEPLNRAIAHAEPISPIYGYRRTESQRRAFHRLPRMPQGFAVTGDAVCAFNPVYGQGMTMAAIASKVLDRTLRGGWDELTFQRRLARANDPAWLMGVMEDSRYDTTDGVKYKWAYRLLNRYNDWMYAGFERSPMLTTAYLRVMHMLALPSSVFHPQLIIERLRLRLLHN